MKRFIVIVFIACGLFAYASQKKVEIKKSNFNLTLSKKIAVSMTASGSGVALLGIGFVSAGASLMSYFFSNSTILEYRDFIPYSYTWLKDDSEGNHLLYYFPGFGLVLAGGLLTVIGLGVALGSIYFWTHEIGAKNKNKISAFAEAGVESKIGLSL
ncbi:MAG TPA: hypothetical protein PLO89_09880 [Spirochaetota bacterium]|nr:hypothetical protein [Spirochaetota bacterium]